jgi:nitroimidazol reductase NimA-like FMN-containing flavoprotein (pyridoxamine 5'-phosphate oxidase superfamily)
MEKQQYKRDRTIKDITKTDEQEKIIRECKVCHVSFVDGDKPYGLSFCFGYEDKTIYLHTSIAGKKLEVLRKNNNVSVFFSTGHEIFYRHENTACSWRMRYKSVIVSGKAEFVTNYNDKIKGLEIFMKNYSEKEFEYSQPSVDNVNIIKIKVDEITGRSFEYH